MGKVIVRKTSNTMKLRQQLLSRLGAFAVKHHLKPPSSLYHFANTPSHNHSYGMVGFVKELVDEQGAADITKGRSNNLPTRESKFENMLITPSIVFVTKKRI